VRSKKNKAFCKIIYVVCRTAKPVCVQREVLRGKEYSAGVGSAENVTSDQSAKHGLRFCLQPEKLSVSLSNAPTFDLSATDGTGITPVYLSVFWGGGMCWG
jgi:hypothetical protein